MSACSFCGQAAKTQIGSLFLCPDCRAQLTGLNPRSAGYIWYVNAVRRALFGQAG